MLLKTRERMKLLIEAHFLFRVNLWYIVGMDRLCSMYISCNSYDMNCGMYYTYSPPSLAAAQLAMETVKSLSGYLYLGCGCVADLLQL